MGFNPESCKNHAAINTIIMAVKKRICYKERLKTHDPATIRSIIEGRMNVEKYLERFYVPKSFQQKHKNC